MLEKVKEIVAIKNQMEELEKQLKALKQQYDELELQVIDYMSKEGLQKITVNDRTVFVSRTLWASVDKRIPDALDILKDNGLGDFIEEKVNSNRISAYVREYEKNDEAIPAWCIEALNITEKFKVGMRKV